MTITVRSYKYNSARNNDLTSWQAAAAYLRQKGYVPILIPDTDALTDGIPAELADMPAVPEASWNVGIRLAFYERAFVNLGVSNGPLYLALLDHKCRALMFKIITGGVPQNEESYIRRQGFKIGGQIPFCTPFQKRIWQDDRLQVIIDEFEAFERSIKSADVA